MGFGRAGRSRTGTYRCPGPRQAAPVPAESVKGLEGSVQAVAAWQILGICHLDSGLLQCLAQGLLPAQHQGLGECFPGARHGTAAPQPGWQHRGAERDLRENTPWAAAPVKPDPRSGRARRSWCHRSPAWRYLGTRGARMSHHGHCGGPDEFLKPELGQPRSPWRSHRAHARGRASGRSALSSLARQKMSPGPHLRSPLSPCMSPLLGCPEDGKAM